ncbi:hypothetical protein [uncultured Hoeflea sp.]|uniref:hypothetical protein n=1 Tax=uncultured Hoeflea sp. TaxID=538666 RepID=UPI00260A9CF0|nr:hypothetical protein [uncultured Hoeflea sp.]
MSGSDSTYHPDFGDGASVLERVLLAIIEAHTTPEAAGAQQERLQAAMVALIGPGTRKGHDMNKALLFMARQRRHAICEAEMLALSGRGGIPPAILTIAELAENAARKFLQCRDTDLPAAVDELCKSFRRYKAGTAIEPDPICEALKTQAVERICDELAEWDIATSRSGRRQSTTI